VKIELETPIIQLKITQVYPPILTQLLIRNRDHLPLNIRKSPLFKQTKFSQYKSFLLRKVFLPLLRNKLLVCKSLHRELRQEFYHEISLLGAFFDVDGVELATEHGQHETADVFGLYEYLFFYFDFLFKPISFSQIEEVM